MGVFERIATWLDPTDGNPMSPVTAAPSIAGINAYSAFDLNDPRLPEFLRDGSVSSTGRVVNEKSSLKNATFFRAVNLISSSVGMLPLNLHEKTAQGSEKATAHPVHKLLKVKPNDYQTPLQFKSYMQGRAVLHGNAYAFKVMSRGKCIALIPMDPKAVEASLNDDWRLTYKWTKKNGSSVSLRQDEVFHLRAPFSSDGITGDGLLKVAVEALGLAGATDDAAGRLMRNGAYVGGVLQHPKALTPNAIRNLAEQFEQRHGGTENAGKWLVAEEGMEAKPFGMSGRDAQGLEQRKYQAEEVSRYTGVPRPLLMFDETSWGSGIEQLGLFLITYCLMPWFVAWEEVVAQSLLTEAERETHYAKFNEGALLRGSLKDQAEFLSKALGAGGAPGYMTQNEARDKFDLNRHDDGDTLNPGSGVSQPTAEPPTDDEPPKPARKAKEPADD